MRGKIGVTDDEAVSRHEAFIRDVEERRVSDASVENCVYLVQFFTEKDQFQQGRKYLCLSDDLAEKTHSGSVFLLAKIHYYKQLMRASADKLQERKQVMIMKKRLDNLDKFTFSTTCRNIIIQYEKHYRSMLAKDWNEAKIIFSDAKKMTDQGVEVFSVDDDLMKRVETVQCLNKMYHHLSSFQQDKTVSADTLDRLSKIHWRRIKIMESCLEHCDQETEEERVKIQELTFELADVYLKLLELKQKKFERTAGNLDPQLLQKMVS